MNLKISSYHKKQHKKIYRSTELFLKFLKTYENLENKKILDIGCGAGANTIYLAKKYPNATIFGIDKNKKAVQFAKEQCKKKRIKNYFFFHSNILTFKKRLDIDFIISFHFLSFTEIFYEKILKKCCNLKVSSMAHSSLFYDGLAEASIEVNDFSKSELKQSPYNIISLPKIQKFLKKYKFKFFVSKPMQIDINLKKPKHKGMGSYTKKSIDGRSYIMSGPLYLPHGYFYSSKRTI